MALSSAGFFGRAFALRIGFEYLRSKKRSSVSVITVIAVAGVALGVGALLAVLSIASGFLDEIRDKVLGVNAHVIVMKYGLDFSEYRDVIRDAKDFPEVSGAAPFLVNEMMLAKGKRLSGVLVKGVAPESLTGVLDLRAQMVDGTTDGLRIATSKPPKTAGRTDTGAAPEGDLDTFLRTLAEEGKDGGVPDADAATADDARELEVLRARAASGKPLVRPGDVRPGETPEAPPSAPLPKVKVPSLEEMSGVLAGLDGADAAPGELPGDLPDDDTERLIFEEEAAEVDDAPHRELPGIVVGQTLAKNVGVGVGDVVTLVSPLTGLDTSMFDATPKVPRSREFRVTGIFAAGFQEYDTRLVYVDLHEAQTFFDHGDTVMGVELRLKDITQAERVARDLETKLGGGPYHTMSWQKLNENLFTALEIQKTMLGLSIATIIVVAAFNVIATLIMIVLEKKREIAILKAMGARLRSVLLIFFVQGTVIGILGTLIGLVLGGGVVAYLAKFPLPLDPKVYLVDHLPIRASLSEFVVTVVVALGICMGATLLPSWWAARMAPVDGLRHE